MAGVFGIVSDEDCINDLFLGTHYLQHRAQDYCGLAVFDGEKLDNHTHKGELKQQFPEEKLARLKGFLGIGCVASDRQPVSEISKSGELILSFDGNIINESELKKEIISDGGFLGYHDFNEINDSSIVLKLISREENIGDGFKKLAEKIKGDFAMIILTKKGIYAARGFGRKPLVLGEKQGVYAVSSESNSFVNTKINIIRDIEPGELVFLDKQGIHSLLKIDLRQRHGTFEWIYTAYPTSAIDSKEVAEIRMKIGRILARKYPVKADFVSPIPNSGRWHAIGFSHESKIPYVECFVRYDYSGRSFTPQKQVDRDKEAKTKLIPVKSVIKDKVIVIVDDSIVRGTQMLNRVKILKELGAKEVHVRIACPPLMCACRYGKTTKKDEDCIARRIPKEEIKEELGLDSLEYATVEDLEEALGISRDKLCLECWQI